MSIDYALYGRRLKEAREAKGWTLHDMVVRADYGTHWISMLESGDQSKPLGSYLEYAAALGIHPSDLFRDEGTMTLSEIQVKLGGSPTIIDVVGMVRESRDAEEDMDRMPSEVDEAFSALKPKTRRTGVIKWDGETDRDAEYRRLRNECAMRVFVSATLEYPTGAQDAFDRADLWLAELKRRDGNG